jgi:hypothetical protein
MGPMVAFWNSRQTQEKLHVCVFSDLLDGLLVAQAKPLLDKQCTKRQPYRLCWGAGGWIELRGICFFQLFPWHQGEENHLAAVCVQRAAKRHIKILD